MPAGPPVGWWLCRPITAGSSSMLPARKDAAGFSARVAAASTMRAFRCGWGIGCGWRASTGLPAAPPWPSWSPAATCCSVPPWPMWIGWLWSPRWRNPTSIRCNSPVSWWPPRAAAPQWTWCSAKRIWWRSWPCGRPALISKPGVIRSFPSRPAPVWGLPPSGITCGLRRASRCCADHPGPARAVC